MQTMRLIDDLFRIMDYWMYLRKNQKSVADFFKDQGLKTIAIHGMGSMALHLIDDLKESGVAVAYIIDNQRGTFYHEKPVLKEDDDLPAVDAIVVTATLRFEEIKKELSGKIKSRFISLDEAVFYNYVS
ncbi:MAG: hypothetical protein FWG91_06840 [Lachnospiraceae bacterium]|nr:hypothetical protein [Lachnospiraceae bacterium]